MDGKPPGSPLMPPILSIGDGAFDPATVHGALPVAHADSAESLRPPPPAVVDPAQRPLGPEEEPPLPAALGGRTENDADAFSDMGTITRLPSLDGDDEYEIALFLQNDNNHFPPAIIMRQRESVGSGHADEFISDGGTGQRVVAPSTADDATGTQGGDGAPTGRPNEPSVLVAAADDSMVIDTAPPAIGPTVFDLVAAVAAAAEALAVDPHLVWRFTAAGALEYDQSDADELGIASPNGGMRSADDDDDEDGDEWGRFASFLDAWIALHPAATGNVHATGMGGPFATQPPRPSFHHSPPPSTTEFLCSCAVASTIAVAARRAARHRDPGPYAPPPPGTGAALLVDAYGHHMGQAGATAPPPNWAAAAAWHAHVNEPLLTPWVRHQAEQVRPSAPERPRHLAPASDGTVAVAEAAVAPALPNAVATSAARIHQLPLHQVPRTRRSERAMQADARSQKRRRDRKVACDAGLYSPLTDEQEAAVERAARKAEHKAYEVFMKSPVTARYKSGLPLAAGKTGASAVADVDARLRAARADVEWSVGSAAHAAAEEILTAVKKETKKLKTVRSRYIREAYHETKRAKALELRRELCHACGGTEPVNGGVVTGPAPRRVCSASRPGGQHGSGSSHSVRHVAPRGTAVENTHGSPAHVEEMATPRRP